MRLRLLKAAVSLAVTLLPFSSAKAADAATGHAAEVEAFARIMADVRVRTAVKVCKGISPNWTVVDVAKERKYLVDCFAFRKEAARRAPALEQGFKAEGTSVGWCSEVSAYGPQGTALAYALRR